MLDRILAAHPLAAALWKVLPEARIAGGAVRDALARLPISDVDFAAPLTPEQTITRLRGENIQCIPTGFAHGTVTAVIGKHHFEITTLRRDIATDGRHATVEFTDDWEADASRRDFTINAMSIDAGGSLFDYFAGQADLAAAKIRFVGEAVRRIREDYLRILRFFRFFARYGGGGTDPDAIAAITALKPGIETLSAERIRSELLRLLGAENPGPAVALMETTGVLPLILPHSNAAQFSALLARGAPADPLLRLAALAGDDGRELAARLKLSNGEEARFTALRAPNTLATGADDADIRRALAVDEAEILIGRSWLAEGEDFANALRHRIAGTARPVFPLQGRDLTALGIAPGPEIGRILAAVQVWWVAGGCTADAAACLVQARLLSGAV